MLDILVVGAGREPSVCPISTKLTVARAIRLMRREDFPRV